MTELSRRKLLGVGAAALTCSAFPGLAFGATERLRDLTLWGPPVGPSVALAHLAQKGKTRALVDNLTFKAWRTPDQLRSGIVSGDMQVSGVPSYVGANLYNKGLRVRMLNIMTWGLLYMMSSDDTVSKLEDIAGKTVTMPFKNDMPDLVFQYITAKAGMKPGKDFNLVYATTPMEVVQMMMVGKADIVILPEPAATATILKGKMNARSVRRVLDIQQEWGVATNGPARIPQAGLLVNADLADKHMDVLRTLQADCIRSSQWALNNPVDAGVIAEDHLGVKAAVTELSMPYVNLETTLALDAKAEIEAFFTRLAELSPKIIGGKLPDAGFYLGL
ncbi:ABC transporter substrate-binding protein [Terasakiella sp.]|uniref:ABC transporter substrate-binding protein n=1 Tax=Terasakiella sp. TaxID=2034861 RepID=UPI003AA8FF0A